ncbi:MAG: hypothetical protein L0387_13310 [Acidobacteria bacterium]|nr:hypothetical protein [Acidobacteriota bacterium]MCI0719864.1 hypothetical protein [Acidobacteriota bacterium]
MNRTLFGYLLVPLVLPLAPSIQANQLVILDTGIVQLSENDHPETHFNWAFTNKPPNNDFTPFGLNKGGSVHVRLEIVERPSTAPYEFAIFINDHKPYGHRRITPFLKVIDIKKGVFESRMPFEEKPVWEAGKRQSIDWRNPGQNVQIMHAAHYMGRYKFEEKPNIPITDQRYYPMKIRLTVTLVPKGEVYDDTGHPGASGRTNQGRSPGFAPDITKEP